MHYELLKSSANMTDIDERYKPGITLYVDEDTDDEILMSLHRRYADRALEAFQGRNRTAFKMPGGYVVKVPKNFDGIDDNDWEASVSNSEESIGHPHYVQYARTRAHYIGPKKDIPVVFMEWVTFAGRRKIEEVLGEEPDWVYSVDCGQVGFNKKGRLVAFDYGCR